jgi:hypothetical protein
VVRFLAWAIGVLLACNVVVASARHLDEGGTRDSKSPGATAAPQTTLGVRTIYVLPPGQAKVTGEATAIAADANVVPVIPVPLTIDVAARGEGGATIEGALVDGESTTIVWDGGRPLQLGGGPGGVDPGPAHVEGTQGRLALLLDGDARGFAPARYRIATTVAVGARGLATPRDAVVFDANAATTMRTRGGARVVLPKRAVDFEGPGAVSMEGRFTVETRDGIRTASRLVFGPGAFILHLDPVAAGWTVTATLQGPLESS